MAVTYSYDLLDRLVEKSYHETGKPDFTIRYTYNAESQLARLRYEEDGETVGSYAFEYDSLGRLIRSTAMDENGSVTQRTEHLYDAFTRLSGQSWTLGAQTYSERYAYSDGEKGDGSLTSMTAATGDSLSFGYDTLKRLNRVTVKNGSSIILNTAYAYRDVSWNRGSAQVEFRNVRLGSDSGMLLEGKKYVYDDVGNLKEIRESTGKYNKLVEYTYDSQNQLTSEAYYKSGEAEAYITYNYTYDTAGNLLTVSQKKGNLQGDVVKLIHYIPGFEYESVATYEYDAWGNILSSSGSLAEINPLRYRGYYYDNETGFYYLQSRYYDPANRRFINADTYSSTDPGDAIGCNMFAYCGNNPVMRNDYSGDAWWHWVVATVAVVGLAVASVVTCGGAAAAAMTATALISGTCTTVPAAATIITGAALGAGVAYAGSVVSAASSVKSTEEFAEYGKSALISTTAGAVVGAVAGAINAATSCFVAGTPVLTEDGDKPIEDVTVGDYVWAWDEATGTTELKQVVETYVNETSELTHIFVNGEEIVATPTHPFYCPVKGWTDAAHLRAGDILVLVNGEYVVVEKIQHELLENPVKVYNFQVQDYHTYYVAESGVLVHNRCLPENSVAMSTDDALDTASDYLGPNYTEVENGRYVSFDGDLQVRIGNADILGQHAGGPHINLDWIGAGKYRTFHIFLLD